jgi:hypothetical protein
MANKKKVKAAAADSRTCAGDMIESGKKPAVLRTLKVG